jgi:hypothetical protein
LNRNITHLLPGGFLREAPAEPNSKNIKVAQQELRPPEIKKLKKKNQNRLLRARLFNAGKERRRQGEKRSPITRKNAEDA